MLSIANFYWLEMIKGVYIPQFLYLAALSSTSVLKLPSGTDTHDSTPSSELKLLVTLLVKIFSEQFIGLLQPVYTTGRIVLNRFARIQFDYRSKLTPVVLNRISSISVRSVEPCLHA